MVKVRVKLCGLSHLTDGGKEMVVEAVNVFDVLEKMKNRYAQFRERAFNPKTGKLYPEFMIVVNGKPVYDHTKKIKDGDVVAILPIFAGG